MAISVNDAEFIDDPPLDDIRLSYHETGAKALFNYFVEFPDNHSYDIIQFEKEYYYTPKNTDYTREEYSQSEEVLWSNPKGEFDLLLLNVDDRQAFYVEIKGSKGGKADGVDQINTAERTFKILQEEHPCFNWDITGVTVASEELSLPGICYEGIEEDEFEGEEVLEPDKQQDSSYQRLKSLLTDENQIKNQKENQLGET